jgi:DNA-binding response OmpR family regulator
MEDVLIVERDELVATVLADALAADGIATAVMPDEQAVTLAPEEAPRVLITGINRGRHEDLTGVNFATVMRRKWPKLCIVYLASLWPVRVSASALSAGDRFLTKPVRLATLTRTVRELLVSGLCGERGRTARASA